MRKQFSALCLTVLSSVALQGPASAHDDSWFRTWDWNHDGHWTWREFRRANNHWYRVHPGVYHEADRELYHRFTELDHHHDGYLTIDEARSFHENWNK